jgi:CDP-diacylglycerol--serine O-phosphatidyltransferase
MSGGGGGKEFLGFPIPAAAGLVASVTLFLMWGEKTDTDFSNGPWRFILPALMLFLSLMMVSEVKYPSFKTLDLKARRTFPKMVATIIFIGLLILARGLILPVILPAIFTLYLLYGFVRPRISHKVRHEIEEEEDDDDRSLTP